MTSRCQADITYLRRYKWLADTEDRRQALGMIASQHSGEDRDYFLEESLLPAPLPPPPWQAPQHGRTVLWERFVMLRKGIHDAGAEAAAGPLLEQLAERQLKSCQPYLKKVAFAAEVEVAPDLLRISIEEAVREDSGSVAHWKDWLNAHWPGAKVLR